MTKGTAAMPLLAEQPYLCRECELPKCVAGLVILEQLLPELKAQDADTLLYPSALEADNLLLACEVPSLHLPAALQDMHHPSQKIRGRAKVAIAYSGMGRHKAGSAHCTAQFH